MAAEPIARPVLPDGALRALVVGPHEASRIGLAVLLEREPWIERCLQAASQGDARTLVRERRPAVTVLDISALGPFVASAMDALRAERPGMPIVLTSPCTAQTRAPAAVDAAAFLPSTATGAQIVRAVHDAVLDLDAGDTAAAPSADERGLTSREREVLELISLGLTNREIAERLHLGPDSIKKHARSLYRKLGVRNRTEAAHHAQRLFAVM